MNDINKKILENYENESINGFPSLPIELRLNFEFLPDAGNCIKCVIQKQVLSGIVDKYNYKNYLVPVPLKRVLEDYNEIFHFTQADGGRMFVIMVDCEYSSKFGLICDDEYYDF